MKDCVYEQTDGKDIFDTILENLPPERVDGAAMFLSGFTSGWKEVNGGKPPMDLAIMLLKMMLGPKEQFERRYERMVERDALIEKLEMASSFEEAWTCLLDLEDLILPDIIIARTLAKDSTRCLSCKDKEKCREFLKARGIIEDARVHLPKNAKMLLGV